MAVNLIRLDHPGLVQNFLLLIGTPATGHPGSPTPYLGQHSSTAFSPSSEHHLSPTPYRSSHSSVHICMSEWSTWINRNSPIGTDGDHEKMSKEELSSFCPGGEITDIECKDSDQGDDWKSLSEATCTVDDGLNCLNTPIDGIPPCRDYTIRYMCKCSGRQSSYY